MYLIVVGGGPLGAHLAALAVENGDEVVVIEPDEERAEHVAKACDALVLNSSIVESDVLERASAERADALIATTADDAQNLMAVVLAREFDIATLVSVVNESTHRQMFERIGAHVMVEPEDILAKHLLRMANRDNENSG